MSLVKSKYSVYSVRTDILLLFVWRLRTFLGRVGYDVVSKYLRYEFESVTNRFPSQINARADVISLWSVFVYTIVT